MLVACFVGCRFCLWLLLLLLPLPLLPPLHLLLLPPLLLPPLLLPNPPPLSIYTKFSFFTQDALQSYFPDFATSSPLVILVQQLNGSSVLNQAVADFDAAMQSRLASYPDSLLKNVTDYQSFFVLLALGSDLAWSLVDATNTSTLIVLNCHPEQAMVLSSADEHFLSFVDHAVRDLSAQFLDPATQRARITGGMAFGRDVTEGTERDLLFMDGIGMNEKKKKEKKRGKKKLAEVCSNEFLSCGIQNIKCIQ